MSWLSRLIPFGRKHESEGLRQAKLEAEVSKDRLTEVMKIEARVERVTVSLEKKRHRNGWGEALAETMRRK